MSRAGSEAKARPLTTAVTTVATDETTGSIHPTTVTTEDNCSTTDHYNDSTVTTEPTTVTTKPAKAATDQTIQESGGEPSIPEVLTSVAGDFLRVPFWGLSVCRVSYVGMRAPGGPSQSRPPRNDRRDNFVKYLHESAPF